MSLPQNLPGRYLKVLIQIQNQQDTKSISKRVELKHFRFLFKLQNLQLILQNELIFDLKLQYFINNKLGRWNNFDLTSITCVRANDLTKDQCLNLLILEQYLKEQEKLAMRKGLAQIGKPQIELEPDSSHDI